MHSEVGKRDDDERKVREEEIRKGWKKGNSRNLSLKKKKKSQLTQSCFCKTVQLVFINSKIKLKE